MDWRHRSACRDEDPELFFPIGNTGPALLQIEEAKAVCRRCEVVEECLTWALESGQDAGVWGGLSEDERRASSLARPSKAAKSRLPVLRDSRRSSAAKVLISLWTGWAASAFAEPKALKRVDLPTLGLPTIAMILLMLLRQTQVGTLRGGNQVA